MTDGSESSESQTPNRPRLLQAVVDAFQQPDIRRKLLYTLGLLVVFRFVAHVPIPGVNTRRCWSRRSRTTPSWASSTCSAAARCAT